MQNKSTNDLKQELMSDSDIDTYIKENRYSFVDCDISDILINLYKSKNISKAELARRSGMSEVYLHQLFSGRRKPSRDKLLCLCIGMKLSIKETQQALKEAACAELYPRIKREAIIYHGIAHSMSLEQINDKLFDKNEKALC